MAQLFNTDNEKWQAIQSRDPAAKGAFVCAVKTTGIYCQASCPARPKRQNVEFFNTRDQAEGAGYRACKRCWK